MSISGAPDAYEGPFSEIHVVARGSNNQLIEWVGSEAVDLSAYAAKIGGGVGDALISSDPRGYRFLHLTPPLPQFTQHVVARSAENRLLEWSWSSSDATWRVVSLTDYAQRVGTEVGPALIAGDPHGYSLELGAGNYTQHIVARSPDNRLLDWSWSPKEATWRVVSLTDHVERVDNYADIAGNPRGYSFTT